jgi:hypothetical protein
MDVPRIVVQLICTDTPIAIPSLTLSRESRANLSIAAQLNLPDPSADMTLYARTRRMNAYIILPAISAADLYPARFFVSKSHHLSLPPLLCASLVSPMALSLSSDVLVLVLVFVLAAFYLFRDQLFSSSSKPKTTTPTVKEANGHGNPRDFVAKMKAGVCRSPYISV